MDGKDLGEKMPDKMENCDADPWILAL